MYTNPGPARDGLFICNIHDHALLTDSLVPKGSRFIVKHGNDFMPINDLAWIGFRVEVGPEGGIYIPDWHDQGICGIAIKFPGSGRVYQVMPEGSLPIVRPNLPVMYDLQLTQL